MAFLTFLIPFYPLFGETRKEYKKNIEKYLRETEEIEKRIAKKSLHFALTSTSDPIIDVLIGYDDWGKGGASLALEFFTKLPDIAGGIAVNPRIHAYKYMMEYTNCVSAFLDSIEAISSEGGNKEDYRIMDGLAWRGMKFLKNFEKRLDKIGTSGDPEFEINEEDLSDLLAIKQECKLKPEIQEMTKIERFNYFISHPFESQYESFTTGEEEERMNDLREKIWKRIEKSKDFKSIKSDMKYDGDVLESKFFNQIHWNKKMSKENKYRLNRLQSSLTVILDPNYKNYFWLGEVYRTNGEYEQALEWYKRAMEEVDDEVYERWLLGSIYRAKAGLAKEADNMELYKEYLAKASQIEKSGESGDDESEDWLGDFLSNVGKSIIESAVEEAIEQGMEQLIGSKSSSNENKSSSSVSSKSSSPSESRGYDGLEVIYMIDKGDTAYVTAYYYNNGKHWTLASEGWGRIKRNNPIGGCYNTWKEAARGAWEKAIKYAKQAGVYVKGSEKNIKYKTYP